MSRNIRYFILIIMVSVMIGCTQSTEEEHAPTQPVLIEKDTLLQQNPILENADPKSETIEEDNVTENEENNNAIEVFKNCFVNNDKQKLTTLVRYPLSRQYPIPPINNAEELLTRFNEVFDKELIQIIKNSDIDTDWSEVGWRGIMLSNGSLWINLEGELIAVNHQSVKEKEIRKNLISQDRAELHESIRDYLYPVAIIETEKFRIRIDNTGEYKYRYTSWNIDKKMNDIPDLVIQNGQLIAEGTGGNHRFEFVNNNYLYNCSIILMAEKAWPPARLTVYKNGEEILSQDAVKLKN